MIAVGIDPSLTSTGVGVLVEGRVKLAARFGREGSNGASYHTRNNRIRILRTEVWKAATVAGHPDVVVLEEQPYQMNSPGQFDRSGLWHLIFEAFDARGIPIVVVGNTVGKSWVTGAGHATKDDVIDVIDDWYGDQIAPRLGDWRKKDHPDDVADALGYATMAAFKLGDPLPFEPKDRHRTALLTLPWPKIARAR
ncbi:RuvC [Mycobacterium phage FlagStaff]|uniref:RuvC n=1 Tax=Mycobacterium phage FlagStaff TaxID=1647304 RepID=A0A0F6YR49_9CAUD|nr:RuvC-like Holliday junction resolvase [Mycobacterium phage FlagStaff]AKF14486.1 RuvC [Mycobacterium phage FlagStaff]